MNFQPRGGAAVEDRENRSGSDQALQLIKRGLMGNGPVPRGPFARELVQGRGNVGELMNKPAKKLYESQKSLQLPLHGRYWPVTTGLNLIITNGHAVTANIKT